MTRVTGMTKVTRVNGMTRVTEVTMDDWDD